MNIRIKAFTILLLVMMLAIPNTVHAVEFNPGYWVESAHVIVESYSVTNERINPGEPFVLTVVIKNASQNIIARDTLVEITNPSGVAPEYGKVAEFYIGDLQPDSSMTVELKYNSWTSINSDTLDFYVTIATSDRSHTTTLRIPAGTEEPFAILAGEIPSSGRQYESLSTSLTFKALGEGDVKDVAYIVKVDGEEAASSSIGIMKPGATKNSAVAFTIPVAGQHTIEVLIRYADEAGQVYYMEVGRQAITIQQSDNPQVNPEEADYIRGDAVEPNYVGMGALAAVIVILFFTLVIILKKK